MTYPSLCRAALPMSQQNACKYARIRNRKGKTAQTGKINEI